MIDLSIMEVAVVAFIGLVAGSLGGLLGVGGSVVILPGLVWMFGQADKPHLNQHVYQAAAMICNVAVAIPATRRHLQAKAVSFAALRWMLPVATLCVVIGVLLSNQFKGTDGAIWLGGVLAGLLASVTIINIRRLSTRAQQAEEAATPSITAWRCGTVGAVMGLIAGLTGVGGGAIAVPMQQMLLKLPLKNCIANSAAIMCVTAIVGAIFKNLTLASLGHDVKVSLLLAALLAPTCWIGGHLGAKLTHILPTRQVRLAFIGLMMISVWRLVLPIFK